MSEKHPYLNIVVTHYDEPWELGKPFFDMLEHQACVDWDRVTVTLVQDGKENSLLWDQLLSGYSYNVDVYTVPHGGVARARNEGIERCTADWIMFCNFDDCFADVCSLSMMLSNLPTTKWDIIWCRCVHQTKWYTGDIYLNKVDEANYASTDGKLYSMKFLREKDIWFQPTPAMHYDVMFNAVCISDADHFRLAELTTDFYPYFKSYRQDSYRHTKEAYAERAHTMFASKCAVAAELQNRGLEFAFRRAVAIAVCSEYYTIYSPESGESADDMTPGFLEFYSEYRDVFRSVGDADLDAILSETETESLNLIQNRYNEYRMEYYFRHDNCTFKQWIETIDEMIDSQSCDPSEPIVADENTVIIDADKKPQRVVVYCGTYAVYVNMVASCKSLLATTPVDKVYFLIEDDVFPYELPDIVETINVKNQTYFKEGSPNYNNCWTWMCMIRAAFPEMFSQYDKILSLDVDVVIDDDVSDLWDYDISDYYLAGVAEHQRQKTASDPMYINFGVVMMNLDKLRRDNKQQQIIDLLNTEKVDCPEQGAYNQVCAGHIMELPADYNYTAYSHITGDAVKERIIHYAGQKFWRHYSKVKQYADLGWEEIMRRQHRLKGEAE